MSWTKSPYSSAAYRNRPVKDMTPQEKAFLESELRIALERIERHYPGEKQFKELLAQKLSETYAPQPTPRPDRQDDTPEKIQSKMFDMFR